MITTGLKRGIRCFSSLPHANLDVFDCFSAGALQCPTQFATTRLLRRFAQVRQLQLAELQQPHALRLRGRLRSGVVDHDLGAMAAERREDLAMLTFPKACRNHIINWCERFFKEAPPALRRRASLKKRELSYIQKVRA